MSDHFSYFLGTLRMEHHTFPLRLLADLLHHQAIPIGAAWQNAPEEKTLPA
jgi:hypothetical protein